MAQQALPQYYRKAYQDLSGGACTRPDPLQVPANKFVQLDNAITSDHDILEKAPGYTVDNFNSPVGTGVNFIRMLLNYRNGTSVNSILAASQTVGVSNATFNVDITQTFGNRQYSAIGYTVGTASFTNGSANVTGSGTAWSTNLKSGDLINVMPVVGAWAEVQSVTNDTALVLTAPWANATAPGSAYMARIMLNTNFMPVGLVFNNKAIISNGSDVMMEFDNTNMLRITDANAPKATKLEKHKNRVFAADANSTIYWSKTNDETVWNAAGKIPVYAQDNGSIVQIKSFANSLLVFKDNGLIYQVVGEFDQDAVGQPAMIRLIDVPDNLGIIAGNTVVRNKDNLLFFLAETGIYTVDMYMHIQKVSWDISPDISNLIFKSSPTSNKQFPFTNQTQWNSGTHNGTYANSSNQLTMYNDRYSFVGAQQANNLASSVIDSSNNVHVGYLNLSGILSYKQFKTDGTVLSETGFTSLGSPVEHILGISVGLSSNGNIGIATSTYQQDANPNGHVRVRYSERVSTGNATFVVGSNSVTGSGTAWSTGATPLTANSLIKNSVDGTFAVVSTVNSDTSITLTAPYSGTASSAAPYVAWSTSVIVATIFNFDNTVLPTYAPAVDIKFLSNDPQILLSTRADSAGGGTIFLEAHLYSRSGGIYTDNLILSTSGGNTDEKTNHRASLYLSGANLTASFMHGSTVIRCWTSTTGGASWTLLENFTVSMVDSDGIQVDRDGGGNSITGYSESGNIKKRNHSTTTTTTLDSTANSQFNGYAFYSSNDYAMNIVGLTPFEVEKYIFLSSSTVQDSAPNRLLTGKRLSRSFGNNGAVFASVAFGINSNEIVVRRLAFKGIWTSAITTDSSLSAWGTYVVTGENDNSATVVQQVALGTTSSLGAPATITNGQVVSTDSTKIYFQVTVTMTIGTLAAPYIGSIVLNYLGAGVDGKTPFAFIFNNELYISATGRGGTSNNTVIYLDRKYSWGNTSLSVGPMARMNQVLYAGSSTNGDVYKLKQGYSFNGSAYTLTATTKEDMLGSLELQKDVSKAYVLYRSQPSGTFTFSYRIDNYRTPGGSAWVDRVVTQTNPGPFEVLIQKPCSSIQFKITQADTGVQVGIIGFVIVYGYLNLR